MLRPSAQALFNKVLREPIVATSRDRCEGLQNRSVFVLLNRMSSKRLEALADFARHKYLLRIECECGGVVLDDPHKIIRACQAWRISYRLDAVAGRLRCEKCGRKPWRVGPGLGRSEGS